MKGIIIAAPHSGSGKTTVAIGLMAALTRRGQRVAPFKVGPDFIDPGYHQLVTGRPSINLDGWICQAPFLLETFLHHSRQSDIAVIEGVMGLFDGLGASTEEGSTAQIARLIKAPVLLVVNAKGMAASVAPLVAGFAHFDPAVRIAGVIFNNVGSDRHARLLSQAVRDHCPDVGFLGAIPRVDTLSIPSRHLGLVTAGDLRPAGDYFDLLADIVERHVNLDALLACADIRSPSAYGLPSAVPRPLQTSVTLAVARDRAFCFMYEDNLRLLREAGAETVFFSPLQDRKLPDGSAGVYLPGGYPELHQEELAANLPMLEAIRQAVRNGIPVYAECGGLLYLTNGFAQSGEKLPVNRLAGVFPTVAYMSERRVALGYREVEPIEDTLPGLRGERLRGHEFHYSYLAEMPASVRRVFNVSRPGDPAVAEGYQHGSCLASYVHLHFGSAPHRGRRFVEACGSGLPPFARRQCAPPTLLKT